MITNYAANLLFGSIPDAIDWEAKRQSDEQRKDYRSLYLCEFPPPPVVGDGAIWKGRQVILKEVEPDGERDRAVVYEIETGKERNVCLSHVMPL